MFQIIPKTAQKMFSLVLVGIFCVYLVFPPILSAELLKLPDPGTTISFSPGYQPAVIAGVVVNSEDPLMFDFIIDRGDSGLLGAELEAETNKLVKYFLAALTIPEEEVWVNLSPYERELMIPFALGITEMGKDMLAQDYLLKQMTASLTHPESEVGKKFWEKVYEKAYKLYGTTEIPINTFSKVWIVPNNAVVLEKDGTAYVVENTLKVMLEEDYLAIEKNLDNTEIGTDQLTKERVEYINNLSAEIVNEIILPELSTEVNEGKNFGLVRQVYNSVILATWYKDRLKETLLGRIYVDRNKVAGVDVSDKTIKEKIYTQYMDALRQGVYNFIKEDVAPGTNETLQRRYFSGGIEFAINVNKTSSPILLGQKAQKNWKSMSSGIATREKSFDNVERYVRARVGLNTTLPILTNTQHVAKTVLPNLSYSAVNAAIDNSTNIPDDRKLELKKEFMAASQESKRTGRPIQLSQVPEMVKEIELGGASGLTENLTGVLPTVSQDVAVSQVDFAKNVVPNLSVPMVNQMIDQSNLSDNERVVLKAEFKQASDIALAEKKPIRLSSLPQLVGALDNIESGLAVEISRSLPSQRPDVVQTQVNVAKQIIPSVSSPLITQAIEGSNISPERKDTLRKEVQAEISKATSENRPISLANIPNLAMDLEKPETGIAAGISRVLPTSSPLVETEQVSMAKQMIPSVTPQVITQAITGSNVAPERKDTLRREVQAEVSRATSENRPISLANIPNLAMDLEKPETGIAAGISRVAPKAGPEMKAGEVNIAKQILPSLTEAVITQAITGSNVAPERKDTLRREVAAEVSRATSENRPVSLANIPNLAMDLEKPETGIAAGISRVLPASSPLVETEQVTMAKQIIPSVTPQVITQAIEGSNVAPERKDTLRREVQAEVSRATSENRPISLANIPNLAMDLEKPETGIAAGISQVAPSARPDTAAAEVNIAKQILPSVTPQIITQAIEGSNVAPERKDTLRREVAAEVSKATSENRPVSLTNIPNLAMDLEKPETGIAAGISRVLPASSPLVETEQVTMAKQIIPSVTPQVITQAIEGSNVAPERKDTLRREVQAEVSRATSENRPISLANIPNLAMDLEKPETGIAAGISRVAPKAGPEMKAGEVNIAKQILPSLTEAVITQAITGSNVAPERKDTLRREVAAEVSKATSENRPISLANIPNLTMDLEKPETGIAAGISRVLPTSSPLVETEQVTMAKNIIPSVSPQVITQAIETANVTPQRKDTLRREVAAEVSKATSENRPVSLANIPNLTMDLEKPETGIAAGISRVLPASSPLVETEQVAMAKQIIPSVTPQVITQAIEGSNVAPERKDTLRREVAAEVSRATSENRPVSLANIPNLAMDLEKPETGIAAGISRVAPKAGPVTAAGEVNIAKQILPSLTEAVITQAISGSNVAPQRKDTLRREVAAEVSKATSENRPISLANIPNLTMDLEKPETGIAAGISRVMPTSSPLVETEQITMAKQIIPSVTPQVITQAIEGSNVAPQRKDTLRREVAAEVSRATSENRPVSLANIPNLAMDLEKPETGIAAGISRVLPTSSPLVETEQVTMAKQIIPSVTPQVITQAIEGSNVAPERKDTLRREVAAEVSRATSENRPVSLANIPNLAMDLEKPETGIAAGISRVAPSARPDTAAGEVNIAKQILPSLTEAVITQAISGSNVAPERKDTLRREVAAEVSKATSENRPVSLANIPNLAMDLEKPETGIAAGISRVLPASSPLVATEQITMAKQIIPSVSPQVITQAIEGSNIAPERKDTLRREVAAEVSKATSENRPVSLANIPNLAMDLEKPETGIAAGISRVMPTSSPLVETEQITMAKQIIPSVTPQVITQAIEGSNVAPQRKDTLRREVAAEVSRATSENRPISLANVPNLAMDLEKPETGIAAGISRVAPKAGPVTAAGEVNIAKQILPSLTEAVITQTISGSNVAPERKDTLRREVAAEVSKATSENRPISLANIPNLVMDLEKPETGIAAGISRVLPTSSPLVETEQVTMAKQIIPSVSPQIITQAISGSNVAPQRKDTLRREVAAEVSRATSENRPISLANIPNLAMDLEKPETGIAAGISRVMPTSSPLVETEQVAMAKQIIPSVTPQIITQAIEGSNVAPQRKDTLRREVQAEVSRATSENRPISLANIPNLAMDLEKPETGIAAGISRIAPKAGPETKAGEVNIAKQILPSLTEAVITQAISGSNVAPERKDTLRREVQAEVSRATSENRPISLANIPNLAMDLEKPETGIAAGISRVMPTSSPLVETEQVTMAKQIIPSVTPQVITQAIEGSNVAPERKDTLRREVQAEVSRATSENRPVSLANIPNLAMDLEKPETGIAAGISRVAPSARPDTAAAEVNIAKQILPSLTEAVITQAISGSNVAPQRKDTLRREVQAEVSKATSENRPISLANIPNLAMDLEKPETGIAAGISRVMPTSSPLVETEQVTMAKQIIPSVTPQIITQAIEGSNVAPERKDTLRREVAAEVSKATSENRPVSLANIPNLAMDLEKPETGIAAGISRVAPKAGPEMKAGEVNIAKQILPSLTEAVITQAISGSNVAPERKDTLRREVQAEVSKATSENRPISLANIPNLAMDLEKPETGIAAGISRVLPTSSPLVETEQVTVAKQIIPSVSPQIITQAIEGSNVAPQRKDTLRREVAAEVSKATSENRPISLANVPNLAMDLEKPETGIAAGISRVVPALTSQVSSERISTAQDMVPNLSPAIIADAINTASLPEAARRELQQEFEPVSRKALSEGKTVEMKNLPKLAAAINNPTTRIAENLLRNVPATPSVETQAMQIESVKAILPQLSSPIVAQAISESNLSEQEQVDLIGKFTVASNLAEKTGRFVDINAIPGLVQAIEKPDTGLALQLAKAVPTKLESAVNKQNLKVNTLSSLANQTRELDALFRKAPDIGAREREQLIQEIQQLKRTGGLSDIKKFRSQASPELLARVTKPPIGPELERVGGINLNAKLFDFQINKEGKGIDIPIALKDGQEINFGGLEPFVIEVVPATPESIPFNESSTDTAVKDDPLRISKY